MIDYAVGLVFIIVFLGALFIILAYAVDEKNTRIKKLKAICHEARAQLLHCQAYDETASPPHHEFGEHIVWEGLSKAEKAYWMTLAKEPNGG